MKIAFVYLASCSGLENSVPEYFKQLVILRGEKQKKASVGQEA